MATDSTADMLASPGPDGAAQPGRLMVRLPAIYHSWEALARLLAVFEAVLLGPGPEASAGLEQEISALPELFALDPLKDPQDLHPLGSSEQLLTWLAGWVGFTPAQAFSAPELRRIVGGIVPLYSLRGTGRYLESVLKLCLPDIEQVIIDDQASGFTLGLSRLGTDTVLVDDRPYWFRVTVRLRRQGGTAFGQTGAEASLDQKIRRLIDFAKPAHTCYALAYAAPGQTAPTSSE